MHICKAMIAQLLNNLLGYLRNNCTWILFIYANANLESNAFLLYRETMRVRELDDVMNNPATNRKYQDYFFHAYVFC